MARKEILQSLDSRYMGRTDTGALTLNDHAIRNFSAEIYEYDGIGFNLEMTHNGCVILATGSEASQVVIPADLDVGFQCTVLQWGVGAVSFLAGAGVTLRQRSGLMTIAGRYGGVAVMIARYNDLAGFEAALMGDLL
jgi:hypothetical protein